MAKNVFTYRANEEAYEMLIPLDSSDFAYPFLMRATACLKSQPYLIEALALKRYPLTFVPDANQNDAKLHFHLHDWILACGVIDEEETIRSVLLVHRVQRDYALVFDTLAKQIIAEIHGLCSVEEEPGVVTPIAFFLETLGVNVFSPALSLSPKKPVNLGYAEETEDLDDEEGPSQEEINASILGASFSGNRKAKIKNFDPQRESVPAIEEEESEEDAPSVDLSSFKAAFSGNKKPGVIARDKPKKPKKIVLPEEKIPAPAPREEPEENEPTAVDLGAFKPAFSGNKKPGVIAREKPKKPAKTNVTARRNEPEPEPEPVTPTLINQPFVPESNKKPKALVDLDLARRKKKLISPAPEPISAPVASLLPEGIVATPRYAYAPSLKGTGYRIRLNDPYSKDTLPLFEAAIAAMPETIMPRVSPSVVFAPEIPSEEALATLIRPLKTEAWDVLVGLFASSGKAAELVLSNKENPSLCLTLLLEGEPTLLAYAGNGFSLSAMRLSFADVLAITKGN